MLRVQTLLAQILEATVHHRRPHGKPLVADGVRVLIDHGYKRYRAHDLLQRHLVLMQVDVTANGRNSDRPKRRLLLCRKRLHLF